MNNTNDDELETDIKICLRRYQADFDSLNESTEKIIALIRSKENDGWISVSDRLPDDGVCVDVWFASNDCDERLADYFYKKDTYQWWQWASEYGGSSYKSVLPSGVTHWRERPQPPIEKEKE